MERHERQLMGPWMTTALVVGGMIGAGIFMLPARLAPYGPNAVAGWLVSGLGALAVGYALSRLAREDGCGIQAYIERKLGPWAGFIVAWAFWVSVWTSNAALALASASGFARMLPMLGGDRIIPTALGILGLLVAVNALGARATGRMAVATTLIKIAPLIMAALILLMGQTGAAPVPLQPLAPMPLGFDAIAAASALTLFALLGFETATAPVGKVRQPERTVPRAILFGTGFVALLYLLSSTAVLLLLPAQVVAGSTAPFADAIGRSWGEEAALLVAFGMAISAFGALNAGIMIAGELGYSMAIRGDLPGILTRTDARGTAISSQLAAASATLLLVLLNADRSAAGLFTFLMLLTTSASLYIYLAGCIAALRTDPSPAALAILIAGMLFTGFAFYGSGMEANGWGLVLLAAGVPIRWAMHRAKRMAAPPAAPPAPAA